MAGSLDALELGSLGSALDHLPRLGDPEIQTRDIEKTGQYGSQATKLDERAPACRRSEVGRKDESVADCHPAPDGCHSHRFDDLLSRKYIGDTRSRASHEPRPSLHRLLRVGLELLLVRENAVGGEALDLVGSVWGGAHRQEESVGVLYGQRKDDRVFRSLSFQFLT